MRADLRRGLAAAVYLRTGERTTTHDLRLTATNGTGSTSDDVRIYIKDPLQCIG
jgi:hypothetical protein